MSASSQNNGKKSSNSSIVNTPASTPITNMSNGNTQANSQNSPPPNNNAPKYGTLVPNRIFVGGISANTTEGELLQLFSTYGTVKAAKIIQDRAGVSKGYGFITFESEDDARRPLREAENIVLRERKLNIAPAIKKQPFSRTFDASSPPAVAAGNPAQFFFPPGAAVPYFQGGVAYYPQTPAAPGDPNAQQPVYQPPPVYPPQTGPQQTTSYPPMMFPAQTFYVPQQYSMPMPYEYNYYPNNGGPPQYMVSTGQGGPGPQCPPMQPSTSPPRPPCFNQQMSYSPGDPMFYNLPIYGTSSIDGQPMFAAEGFDITAGPYNEDTYNLVDNTSQDLDSSDIPPPLLLTAVNDPEPQLDSCEIVETTDNNNQQVTNSLSDSSSQPSQSSQPRDATIQLDATRNSTTPVVSLLSIDQQQEKDYISMQGGRRRKSAPIHSTNSSNHMQPMNFSSANGYVQNYSFAPPGPSLFPPFSNVSNNFLPHDPSAFRYGNNRQIQNGFDRSKRRRNYPERRNDNSSRSSLRTDSNSSASLADDNKNEGVLRTNVNTPPPAPYSPMNNHGNFRFNTGMPSRTIHNNNTSGFRQHRYNNSGYNNERRVATSHNRNLKPTFPLNNNNNKSTNNNIPNNKRPTVPTMQAPLPQQQQQTLATSQTFLSGDDIIAKNNNNKTKDQSNISYKISNNIHSSPQQLVHSSGGGGTNGGSNASVSGNQSFVQTARRCKKANRRNTPGAVNEIGAGDAPLPNDVTDTCKKMETLKL